MKAWTKFVAPAARGLLAAGVLLTAGGMLATGKALAHGSGEIEIFSYLLEEKGFFRLTAGILGSCILSLGAFIAWQGRRVWERMAAEADSENGSGNGAADASPIQMMAPGGLLALVGAGIIFAAIFILPDQVKTGGHHPAKKSPAAKSESAKPR